MSGLAPRAGESVADWVARLYDEIDSLDSDAGTRLDLRDRMDAVNRRNGMAHLIPDRSLVG